ncbi:TetR/AcrR family transcriptional regulator [Streptomyces sediminimaris]|uniref:TetR/AcrR family transcriptional regulator n=1 Tax=Streptomyces sediminimaris TaxID=3383721 RepID=UPI00399986BF
MTAAAELIGEVGWGRVTTRAVAERAGLPHGAVSYHFRGKQDLLIEASMSAFANAMPYAEFATPSTMDELLTLVGAEIGAGVAGNRALTRLMFESLREAERDEKLRARLGEMLATYRQVIVDLVRTTQADGAMPAQVSPEGVATLLGAVGDGLLLHALLDPDLDVAGALETLRALLARR